MDEYKSMFSMLAWRFVRGAIAGAVSTMAMIQFVGGVNALADLQTFFASLAVAGVVGAVSGGLLAADKWIRSAWNNE